MINKLIEFEAGFVNNVVTLEKPSAPRLSANTGERRAPTEADARKNGKPRRAFSIP
jgi:hypothetical protein